MKNKEQRFIEWLGKLDSKAYAILRRALTAQAQCGQGVEDLFGCESTASSPESYIPAYPYVEPFLVNENETENYKRRIYYLVAGLYCLVNRPKESEDVNQIDENQDTQEPDIPQNLGCTVALLHRDKYPKHLESEPPTSLEQRFLTLLDSDSEQLPYYMRQMLSLLKDWPVDWVQLTKDLLYWNSKVKQAWAQSFYRKYHSHTLKGTET